MTETQKQGAQASKRLPGVKETKGVKEKGVKGGNLKGGSGKPSKGVKGVHGKTRACQVKVVRRSNGACRRLSSRASRDGTWQRRRAKPLDPRNHPRWSTA